MTKNILIILFLLPTFVFAQDAKTLLRNYFNEVRAGKYPPIPAPFSLPENARKLLTEIKPYYNDTSANVRSKAYSIIRFVGTKSRVTTVREECVARLVNACKDKDTGNMSTALGYLTQFYKQDFTTQSLDNMRSLLKSSPSHIDRVMRLVGFLNLQDMKSIIQPYKEAGNSQSVRWSAIVSLARMGDADATEEMMRRSKKIKVNDDVIYEVFPDLIYSHQRVAYDYMVSVLMSEEKNCISSNPNSEVPIQCGYRIMEQLAPVIEGYPLTVGESGDLETDNYEEALATVRVWFKENGEYRIKGEGY